MTMNATSLSYGRGYLDIALPPGAQPTLIRKRALPKLADPHQAIATALNAPVAAAPLSELAKGRNSACILICDITRPVPNRLFLRPMIETMVAAGIPLQAISVLVATGLHRPNLGDELAELIGDPWVLENVRVDNHYARDEAAHVDLGRTRTRNTPVKLDRLFVEADLQDRHRPGRAAFHGRLVGWPQGHRAGGRPSRDDPHLSLGPLHGGPAGRPVQSDRQSPA